MIAYWYHDRPHSIIITSQSIIMEETGSMDGKEKDEKKNKKNKNQTHKVRPPKSKSVQKFKFRRYLIVDR